MFLRKTTREYKDKTYTNHLLVESVRTPDGPRQKVIVSLGDLEPRPHAEWLKLVHKAEGALRGEPQPFENPHGEAEQFREKAKEPKPRRDGEDPDILSVKVDDVSTERSREGGPVHVGYQFWKRLGLDEILRDVGLTKRARLLTCAMTLNRLIFPLSEHAMPNWINRTALDDILGVNFNSLSHHSLYRNMDRLYPNRAAIESALTKRERRLFKLEGSVLLYDLTSTYFEGQALANPKAMLGYSRDKRSDCKQVVVGLVLGREGFPLGHEVLEGNVQDRQTVSRMLELLDNRVGLTEGQTVIVDRGMAYDGNIDEIQSWKLHYLVASRQPERDQWLAELEDETGFEEIVRTPSPRNLGQKKTRIRIKRETRDSLSYVLCQSDGRKEKDKAIREKKEAKLLVDLDRLKKRVAKGSLKQKEKIWEAIGRIKERYPRVARYYSIDYDQKSGELTYEVIAAKREKAESLDGSYLLKSDREDLSADEAWLLYALLTRVENAFRVMKSPLAERPIFHHLERRVDTHIFLCVLAYHLVVAIENTFLDQGVHTSWATVRETLKTHQVNTIVLPTQEGTVLKIRKGSTPEPEHLELYRLLDVPTQIIRPVKTWTW